MVNEINIVEVDLGMSVSSDPIVVIGQPEWLETDFEKLDEGFRLRDDKLAEPWIKRVLLKAEEHSASLVLFPELSIPESFIKEICYWTKENQTIVVAGSHYQNKQGLRFSVSPVIVNGQIYNQAKIQLSPSELSAVSTSGNLQSGKEILVFKNSTVGTFCNLICADYLAARVRNTIQDCSIDVLSIVAFQKNSNRYYQLMESEVNSREKGVFCIYSNPIMENLADGNSALFGVLDKRLYASDLKKIEQLDEHFENLVLRAKQNHFLVFSLDIQNKTPALRHTHETRPNVVLITTDRFEKKEPFASVSVDKRPEKEGTNFGNFPIKEQVQSLVAKHGYDDPDWVRAFSSMIFLDRLATLLGQSNSDDLMAMQNEFLSYFRIQADDSLILSEERVLVTPEENQRMLQAMMEEDEIDGDFQKYPKLRAENVDISKLHQNYLYAVALGISGNKESRIMTTIRDSVLEHFFLDSGAENRDPHGGWTPFRTPWVTARVLINYGRLEHENSELTQRFQGQISDALNSLINRVHSIGIWKSGAGTWVSDWEATALVLEAFLVNDGTGEFRTRIEEITRIVLEKKSEWLPENPAFVDEENSNKSLAATIMCSVILRLQEKYLDNVVMNMDEVDEFYRFLSEALTAISTNSQVNTRQFCTIPQVACYCAEVVA